MMCCLHSGSVAVAQGIEDLHPVCDLLLLDYLSSTSTFIAISCYAIAYNLLLMQNPQMVEN